ncbi:hypothetical protein GF339_15975 [candidate division KSB3 bacterium]|uniref:Uncharacterized protein n=1 Tax=candidate division KSB3 bacterium TaxID=2044937 RepID=A0A9D5Q6P7_9BACT|nr:hypothetical protein [candidate division KSB3 bacterium]MBD3326084.1 hypothetical protein [candidate division KSB3 bacterium]
MFNSITSHHITGFVVGLGVSALGFYAYKKNQEKVDEFLRRQGIQLPQRHARDESTMTLEELIAEKEHLEDLIAERELTARDSSPMA